MLIDEMAVATVQMGLSREDYLNSTPFEFERMYARWVEMVKAEQEQELWQKMYVARLVLFKTLCPPKGKTIKMTDFFELPGEADAMLQERRRRKSTQERFEALKKIWG